MTQGALVDASLITAPSSTKSKDHARDPEMHEAKNDAQLNVMFLVQYCFKLEYLSQGIILLILEPFLLGVFFRGSVRISYRSLHLRPHSLLLQLNLRSLRIQN